MKSKQYSNGKISIIWQPDLCIHSGICVKTLPQVYNPNERPWIKMENATTEQLIAQVANCPSGALSIKYLGNFELEDNSKSGNIAYKENGEAIGEVSFVWVGNETFIIEHTEVKEEHKGKGIAKELVMKAIEYAREKKVTIIPLCPYAKGVFDKNPDLSDVMYKGRFS